ncbi:MAG TPA: VOC family protein [Chthonomonadaceae bacterium]|nr:VOC family protein [Chthonomonadaceae bacterium]
MQLNPYLSFNGQCQAAFTYYQQVLGGEIVAMLNYADSPVADQTSPEWRNKIIHARLIVGDKVLMGSDSPPQYQTETKGMCVALGVDDATEAERIFNALSENGTVQMPIQETFFAIRFGMCIDQFGIPWMVNCEKAS